MLKETMVYFFIIFPQILKRLEGESERVIIKRWIEHITLHNRIF